MSSFLNKIDDGLFLLSSFGQILYSFRSLLLAKGHSRRLRAKSPVLFELDHLLVLILIKGKPSQVLLFKSCMIFLIKNIKLDLLLFRIIIESVITLLALLLLRWDLVNSPDTALSILFVGRCFLENPQPLHFVFEGSFELSFVFS